MNQPASQRNQTIQGITPEMLAYAADYLRLKIIRNLLAPIVKNIQASALKEHTCVVGKGVAITSSDQLSNKDLVTFRKTVNDLQKKVGLANKDPMVCPLLKVEELQRNARIKFINAFTPLTGITTHKILCSKNALGKLAKVEEALLTQVRGIKEFKSRSAMTTHFIESIRKEITGYGKEPVDLAKIMSVGNDMATIKERKNPALKRSA